MLHQNKIPSHLTFIFLTCIILTLISRIKATIEKKTRENFQNFQNKSNQPSKGKFIVFVCVCDHVENVNLTHEPQTGHWMETLQTEEKYQHISKYLISSQWPSSNSTLKNNIKLSHEGQGKKIRYQYGNILFCSWKGVWLQRIWICH